MPTTEELIRQEAAKQGVPPDLALAIADVESGLNPNTRPGPKLPSGEQAVGLFQILPSTAKARGIDATDPYQNLTGGISYIKDLLDKHQGDRDKVIAEYGGVKNDTVYVPKVLDRISKFGGTDERVATAPPTSATTGMLAPSTATGEAPQEASIATKVGRGAIRRFVGQAGSAALLEPLQGVLGLARTATSEGPVAAGKQLLSGITEPVVSGLQKATKAREEGNPKEWVKNIVGAIPIYGPTLQQTGELAAQGDIAGAAGRLVGGIVPIKGASGTARTLLKATPEARSAMAAAVKESAAASMTKLFKAASDGSEGALREINKIVPLAMDQSLLRVTRGKWATAVREAMEPIGEKIGAKVKGPLGNTVVPLDPPIQALEHLKDSVTNFVPVDDAGQPIGAGAARASDMLTAVQFNKRLIKQIDEHIDILRAHGPTAYLRQLVNLRRDWDDFVYSSRQFLNRDDMVKQYEARAKSSATDAIRGIIDQDPRLIELSDLDKAYSAHKKLYSYIADEAFGRGHGIPYYPGFGIRASMTRRIFEAAVKSPSWKLLGIKGRLKLAEAMASNNETAVRNILRPIVVGGVQAVGRPQDPNDLITHQQDERLVGGGQ